MYQALYNKISNRTEKISFIDSGYIGMPIAVAFLKYNLVFLFQNVNPNCFWYGFYCYAAA